VTAIEAIKFNHDAGGVIHDAVNIRKNAAEFIAVPEWRRFISVNPEDCRRCTPLSRRKGGPSAYRCR